MQGLRPKTIADVFASSVPSVVTVARECGMDVARAALVLPVTEMLGFFNVENTMSAQQVAFTIDLLIDEYPYLKLDDYKMCFRNVMLGHYGKVYNRIDGQMVLEWVQAYARERAQTADEISYNEHKRAKAAEGTGGVFYEDYRRELERMAAAGNGEAAERLRMSENVVNVFKDWKLRKLEKSLESYEQWKKEHEDQVPQAGT